MRYLALLLLVFSTSAAKASEPGPVTIDGDTPWVVMEDDFDNPPIQEAIRDAERDWYRVFGYPPVIFKNSIPRSWTGPVIVLGSVENTKKLVDVSVPKGAEQHVMKLAQTKKNPSCDCCDWR